MYGHIPVLLHEALQFLQPKPGGRYFDGTLGLGGHSEAILKACDGELLGLDRDPNALAKASKRLAPFGKRAHLRQSCFSDFDTQLKQLGWSGLDGALLDLGVSSMQLDVPERGFSFLHDGPLDMRMGHNGEAIQDKESAFGLISSLSYEELRKIIAEYGEEPMAAPIAKAIIKARAEGIYSTTQLAQIVEGAYPPKWRATARRHPATRTFQAIRMAVNRELEELKSFLERIPQWLLPGARLVIISFHSLEDRMVKQAFKRGAENCICPKHLPVCVCNNKAIYNIITKKPVLPSQEECEKNPRAGCAKMRVVEKI